MAACSDYWNFADAGIPPCCPGGRSYNPGAFGRKLIDSLVKAGMEALELKRLKELMEQGEWRKEEQVRLPRLGEPVPVRVTYSTKQWLD